jgi:transposase
MAMNFLACDREQAFLMPPDPRDWLPEDHLAWFVLASVEEMDLAAFYGSYRQDGWGRAAFEPSMMVALLMYAYAQGERSSRGIERRCVEDVAYRVIAAQQTPDHATIARFRVRHEAALAGLFSEVLGLCRESGLVKVGVIAIDGTKVHANASHPEAIVARTQGREGWLREARHQLDEHRRLAGDPIPRSRSERLLECERRLQENLRVEREANEAYEHHRATGVMKDGRRFGARPNPYVAPELPPGNINVTDLDSRNVKTPRSYTQGYNVQAVVNEQQIVVAAEVTLSSPDFGQLEPMIKATRRELEQVGVSDTPGVALADSGYWHEQQIEQVVNMGTQVLIPPDAGKHEKPRRGWNGGRYAFMRTVLAGDIGAGLYRKRKAMVEPVFAQTKHNRRINQFQRRGRSAARSEWRLITATHNLMKLHKHHLAVQAA